MFHVIQNEVYVSQKIVRAFFLNHAVRLILLPETESERETFMGVHVTVTNITDELVAL